jgi:four helix bundle protein
MKYDLEERTEKFSLSVRDFCLQVKHSLINMEYIKQLVRSAGSIAANYIEANENLGKNNLKMRIKISKKETKESRLWLKHIIIKDEQLEETRRILIQETIELQNIFAAILKKIEFK